MKETGSSTDGTAYYPDELIGGHLGEERGNYYDAIVPPVFLTSLHTADCIENYQHTPEGRYIYGRHGNPTVEICERKIAALEHGKRAFLYASGMAAATSAVLAVCRPGSHVVCVHNAYGGLQGYLNDLAGPDLQIKTTYVHGYNTEEIIGAVRENTVMIFLESPGSATFTLVDLKTVAAFAKERGIITYTDNSYCSPVFQKPLKMGIDIVMHSCTKYLGGHSDLLGGVLVTSSDSLISRLDTLRIMYGNIIGPMEAWLMIRGIRTLSVRMDRHHRIALEVARALEKDPRIKKVYYPDLESHPQYALAKEQQTGCSGLLSFEPELSFEQTVRFINHLKLFSIGPSWGGYESLAVMPLYESSEEHAAWYGASRTLVRIHCGFEGADLLLEDISQALRC